MTHATAAKGLDAIRLCELTRASADASSRAFAQFAGLPLRLSGTVAVRLSALERI